MQGRLALLFSGQRRSPFFARLASLSHGDVPTKKCALFGSYKFKKVISGRGLSRYYWQSIKVEERYAGYEDLMSVVALV